MSALIGYAIATDFVDEEGYVASEVGAIYPTIESAEAFLAGTSPENVERLNARVCEVRSSHGAPLRHGTSYGYRDRGCRCEACKAWNSAKCNAMRNRRWGTEPPVHGNSGYANFGCRCDVCKSASRAYQAEQRSRRRS